MARSFAPLKTALSASMVLFACASTASELDLRINNDSLVGQVNFDAESSSLEYGLGYFYKDDDESVHLFNFDLHATGQTAIGNLPTTLKIGLQANYFKEDELKASAAGVGGTARVNLPDVPGLAIETEIHYAPDILSFSDAESFLRSRFQVNYRIIETADVIGGFRYIRAKFEDTGSHKFDSGAFIGVRLSF